MTDQVRRLEEQVIAATDPHQRIDAMIALALELMNAEPARGRELADQAHREARAIGYAGGEANVLRVLAYGNIAFSSNHDEAGKQLEECLRIFREIGDRTGEGKTLNMLGSLLRRLGDGPKALIHHEQSLEIARQTGNRADEAAALNGIGHAYRMIGETEQALRAHGSSLEIATGIDAIAEMATALNGLGNTHEKLGEFTTALDYYVRCLEIAERLRHRQLIAYSSGNIAIIYQRLGDNATALRYELDSLHSKQQIGDRWGEGVSYNNIGIIYKSLGEYANALEAHLKSLRITEEIGDLQGESVSLNNIGQIYQLLGDAPSALDCYLRSLHISEGLDHKQGEAFSLGHIGRFYEGQGDYSRALIHYIKSLNIHRTIGDRYGEREALKGIGDIYLYLGEHEKAAEQYNSSLRIAETIGDREGKVIVLLSLAELRRRDGDYDEAAALLQKSLKIAEEIGNKELTGQALNNLSEVYRMLGDAEGSATFHRMYVEANRQIFNDEMKRRIREQIAAFEGVNARREAQLLGLRQEDLAEVNEALHKVSHLRAEQMLEQKEEGKGKEGAEKGDIANERDESSPRIQVRTFGEFSVTLAGRELRKSDWQRKRARDLFKFLLLHHGGAVTIDEIVEHLWGGLSDRNVELLVMNAISHIRKALEPGREPHKISSLLASRDRTYTLDLGDEAFIDFIRFRKLIADARRVPAPELKRRLYMEAAALHRGEFLKEDIYESWSAPERERLREMLLEALIFLADWHLRIGELDEAITSAREIIAHDNTSEQGYGILLMALHQSGQAAEARRVYRQCVTAFREELGIEPPEQLGKLIEVTTGA